jgi:hypothetical protein
VRRPSGVGAELAPRDGRRTRDGSAAPAPFRAALRWLVAAALLLGPPSARSEAPPPKAGIVPLELAQVASAAGPELRIAAGAGPEMSLAGKRVRFTAQVAGASRTAAGEETLSLRSGDASLVLRLPGPLVDPGRLDGDATWEVIARVDRPVTLSDGRSAIAVGPDALVKTPGRPAEVLPTDTVVEIAGSELFRNPAVAPWESERPLYRVKQLKQNERGLRLDFTEPGPTAMAREKDDAGRELIDVRQVARAPGSRERATRCVFRVEGDKLKSVAFGSADVAPSGERSNEVWVDFEKDEFHDKWSARQRHFEPNTYAGACLAFAVLGTPTEGSSVVRFFVVGDDANPHPTPLYAYADGEETIDVRGRAERARRVRVGLDVRRAAANIDVPEAWRHYAEAGSEVWFAGESTYWIALEGEPVLLRFRGPLGPPGAPEALIERVE